VEGIDHLLAKICPNMVKYCHFKDVVELPAIPAATLAELLLILALAAEVGVVLLRVGVGMLPERVEQAVFGIVQVGLVVGLVVEVEARLLLVVH